MFPVQVRGPDHAAGHQRAALAHEIAQYVSLFRGDHGFIEKQQRIDRFAQLGAGGEIQRRHEFVWRLAGAQGIGHADVGFLPFHGVDRVVVAAVGGEQ
ncbi:hypothetical protein SDC9_92095 [bioreactor metagenome]|uniref:Uncharacterized protein n=1 Tax=bioreactor metagenome TaxID=1076179 RepID=A0A644ZYA4_9ZZZZ